MSTAVARLASGRGALLAHQSLQPHSQTHGDPQCRVRLQITTPGGTLHPLYSKKCKRSRRPTRRSRCGPRPWRTGRSGCWSERGFTRKCPLKTPHALFYPPLPLNRRNVYRTPCAKRHLRGTSRSGERVKHGRSPRPGEGQRAPRHSGAGAQHRAV